jgi:hypothetical protein
MFWVIFSVITIIMIIGEIYPNFIIKCIQLVGGDASDTIYIGIFFWIWKLFCVGLIVYFIFK